MYLPTYLFISTATVNNPLHLPTRPDTATVRTVGMSLTDSQDDLNLFLQPNCTTREEFVVKFIVWQYFSTSGVLHAQCYCYCYCWLQPLRNTTADLPKTCEKHISLFNVNVWCLLSVTQLVLRPMAVRSTCTQCVYIFGARGGAVGLGTALQTGRSRARFPLASSTHSFRPRYVLWDDSASNRNECQEHFLGSKGGRCVRLTTLPPSFADCLEI